MQVEQDQVAQIDWCPVNTSLYGGCGVRSTVTARLALKARPFCSNIIHLLFDQKEKRNTLPIYFSRYFASYQPINQNPRRTLLQAQTTHTNVFHRNCHSRSRFCVTLVCSWSQKAETHHQRWPETATGTETLTDHRKPPPAGCTTAPRPAKAVPKIWTHHVLKARDFSPSHRGLVPTSR